MTGCSWHNAKQENLSIMKNSAEQESMHADDSPCLLLHVLFCLTSTLQVHVGRTFFVQCGDKVSGHSICEENFLSSNIRKKIFHVDDHKQFQRFSFEIIFPTKSELNF
jgi:hypothetical protein